MFEYGSCCKSLFEVVECDLCGVVPGIWYVLFEKFVERFGKIGVFVNETTIEVCETKESA